MTSSPRIPHRALHRTLRRAWLIAALTAPAALACRGTELNGPRRGGPAAASDFDAARVHGDVKAAEGAMAAPVMASFAALSDAFPLAPGAAAAVAGARELVSPAARPTLLGARRAATAMAGRLLAAAPGILAGVSVLPGASLGTTYVYDPARQRYVAAPGRAGAPASGVRFILYAVNPLTRRPVVEAEIGWADLLDTGASRPSGAALRLVVVSGGVTYLDYAVALDGTETTGSLSVSGFVSDGDTRLDFQIDARGTSGPTGQTQSVDVHLAVPARGFSVTAAVRGAATTAGGTQQVAMTVRSGDATIGFQVTSDDFAVSATVSVNGAPFATITGRHQSPEVRGAGGRELGPEEQQALQQALGVIDGAFRMFGDLMRPVELVMALSRVP